jgi:hypothetical protein
MSDFKNGKGYGLARLNHNVGISDIRFSSRSEHTMDSTQFKIASTRVYMTAPSDRASDDNDLKEYHACHPRQLSPSSLRDDHWIVWIS